MYGLSYIWHGMVLNDFLKLSYPKDLFLSLAAVVYFGVALFITVLTYMLKRIKDSFKWGIAIGASVGIFMYAIALLLGLSFNTQIDLTHLAVDVAWQTFEQGMGGLMCGWIYRTLYLKEKRLSH
jgi:hypothetical protein